ncbi:hypothetical protein cyc_04429 [Cyclospora cayetanensis]|uniref:3'-5' exonuclease domain-containing protein n=1 Tax=Cyclospora cayetanensis TaxID=88456 RepID=A0A1D3CR37_9EIME|nr:hypothetical protein cyc_04429 [Cyclospora cayetanensis]
MGTQPLNDCNEQRATAQGLIDESDRPPEAPRSRALASIVFAVAGRVSWVPYPRFTALCDSLAIRDPPNVETKVDKPPATIKQFSLGKQDFPCFCSRGVNVHVGKPDPVELLLTFPLPQAPVRASYRLESYSAHSAAWSRLGLIGALRLNEGPRAHGLYGTSLRRLIFLVSDADTAQLWSHKLAACHAQESPLLLSVDLEWAFPAVSSERCNDGHSVKAPRAQVSLLQPLDPPEKRCEGAATLQKGATLSAPLAPLSSTRACGPPAPLGADSTCVIHEAAVSAAVAAAVKIGFVGLFDLKPAPDRTVQHLGALLQNPNIPKVMHDCREDSAILHACFGVHLKSVFDSMVAAQVLQRSRGCEEFQQSLNDLLLEQLGVAGAHEREPRAYLSCFFAISAIPSKSARSNFSGVTLTFGCRGLFLRQQQLRLGHLFSFPLMCSAPAIERRSFTLLIRCTLVFKTHLAAAQEAECATRSALHADYCLLNTTSSAEPTGGAPRAANYLGNDRPPQEGSAKGLAKADEMPHRRPSEDRQGHLSACSPPLGDLQGEEGPPLEAPAGKGQAKKPPASLKPLEKKRIPAPGCEIEGLVAVAGPQRLLLKVNLGDPRLVAIADAAEATACLRRSSRVGEKLRLLVRGRHPRTKALIVSVLPS